MSTCADTLRRAAGRLRELSDAATPGPWDADGTEISQDWSRPKPWLTVVSDEVVCMDYCYGGRGRGIDNPADAAYIAAMHPGIGLALADWLEAEAHRWEHSEDAVDLTQALRVARLILGESDD